MDKKKIDILKHGKHSPYWEEYTKGLPWDNDSTETKFYVAGILSGFSHDFVLGKMIEQKKLHDNFRDIGFFIWTEFFNKLRQENTEQPKISQIYINGNVTGSNIIIGDENIIQNKEEALALIDEGKPWEINVSSINYLNVPRIMMDIASKGSYPKIPIQIDPERGLRGLGLNLVHILMAFETFFTNIHPKSLDLIDPKSLNPNYIGAIITFDNTFRTKNVPYPDKVKSGRYMSKGNLEKDPHIYCKIHGKKVYLPLDPIWITTSTAFVDFSSGIKRFAGLGLLKDVGPNKAIISPFVIGQPKPSFPLYELFRT